MIQSQSIQGKPFSYIEVKIILFMENVKPTCFPLCKQHHAGKKKIKDIWKQLGRLFVAIILYIFPRSAACFIQIPRPRKFSKIFFFFRDCFFNTLPFFRGKVYGVHSLILVFSFHFEWKREKYVKPVRWDKLWKCIRRIQPAFRIITFMRVSRSIRLFSVQHHVNWSSLKSGCFWHWKILTEGLIMVFSYGKQSTRKKGWKVFRITNFTGWIASLFWFSKSCLIIVRREKFFSIATRNEFFFLRFQILIF